jgi:hypothetical protein
VSVIYSAKSSSRNHTVQHRFAGWRLQETDYRQFEEGTSSPPGTPQSSILHETTVNPATEQHIDIAVAAIDVVRMAGTSTAGCGIAKPTLCVRDER